MQNGLLGVPLGAVQPQRFPPGYVLDFVSRTTNLSLSTEVDWIVGNPVSYDGNTRVKIECWAAAVDTAPAPSGGIFRLYDGASVQNRMADVRGGAEQVMYGCITITPTAGVHIYKITAAIAGSGSLSVNANPVGGGTGAYAPSWYRITVA